MFCDVRGRFHLLPAQFDIKGDDTHLHYGQKNLPLVYHNSCVTGNGGYSPQINSTLPKRTLSPTLTPASSSALVTPILASVTCRRAMPSSLSRLVIFTARSTRFPLTM